MREKICRSQAFTIIPAIICLYINLAPGIAHGTENYKQRYAEDVQTILSSRQGMQTSIAFLDEHPEIFPATKIKANEHQMSREQRMIVWQSWQNFLDHILFFDTMGSMYAEVYKNEEGKENKRQPFLAAYACFLAQYRFAMDYIERMELNPSMHIILNESVPELGLEEGTYSKIKFRFLNVIRGVEFARLNILYLYFNGSESPLKKIIEEDNDKIWEAGRGKGPKLTAQNALKIVGDLGFTAWFPVQKNVSALMGEIKVWRPGISLISLRQIDALKEEMQPGDIMLQRREWYATNVGIPGFWTHAALYIGTPEERNGYFSGPELAKKFSAKGSKDGTLDGLLQFLNPDEYKLSVKPQEENHRPRVLEAIGEGVSFTTLEHSAAADAMVVLRPNLPIDNIAQAIVRAFHYSGRPYDFNFDFRTDSELVCSELIYKAYEPAQGLAGLSLPLAEVMNRPLLSPNEIARLFDQEYGTRHQQFSMVTFLDGNEKEYKAVESTVEEFRISWKRPKWHVWMQDTPEK